MQNPVDLTTPITREQVEALIDWTRYPLDSVPADKRPIVVTYEHTNAGIEDCFDYFDGGTIREMANLAINTSGKTMAAEADRFVRGHLGMLGTWHDALDGLDSELRGHVVAGGLPEWAHTLLKCEARKLFLASNTLLRAIAEYHHGNAGPGLSEDYGFAYELSNSALSLFP